MQQTIPGAAHDHDAVAVQLCLSAGLTEAAADALIDRLKGELRMRPEPNPPQQRGHQQPRQRAEPRPETTMPTSLDRLQECLENAIRVAKMERASFGFPNDRITVTSAHMGDFAGTKIKQGDAIHPTDFILEMTKLYRETWLIPPLEEALGLVSQHQELLRQLQQAQETIARLRLDRLQVLAAAGMRDN